MRDRLTGDFGTGYSYWPSIWGAVVPILRSLTGGMTFSPKESVSFSFFCVSWLYHLHKQNTIHIWNTNLQKTNIPGHFFLFTPQNPARHERCDCCGTRHSAPGPPKMRPSRFIATLYYYSLFFFSILFNFINSQLFYTKLVLIFYRKCVIMPRLKVFIRSPQQRHKLLRFTPVGRKKTITRHATVIIEAKYLQICPFFGTSPAKYSPVKVFPDRFVCAYQPFQIDPHQKG